MPEPTTAEAAPRMELPPPLPISSPSEAIQKGLGTAGIGETIPEALLDVPVGYYLLVDNRRFGPLEKSRLLGAGLDHGTLVWYPGAEGWRPARNVESLQDLLHYVPPPAPGLAAWSNPALLPSPRTYHTLYWSYFWVTMAGLFFLVLMITFIILFENVRTFPGGGRFGRNPTFEMLAIFSGAIAFLFGIASIILFLMLLYQMWKAIQDGYVQVSPPSAVGLLLVPVFNFFWIFIAIFGLARESNLFIQRHGYVARPAPVGLALATCICLLIPWVNLVTAIPLLLVTSAMLKNTAVDIVEARLGEEG